MRHTMFLAPATALAALTLMLPGHGVAQVSWSGVLTQSPEWYASAEARAIAGSVLHYQSTAGGWPKNIDMTRPPPSPELFADPGPGAENTIDNGATTTQIRYLALVAAATGESRYRRAVERGIDYLLGAQYPNGGWPQFHPLREGYYSHITYNDDAMARVLTLLREVAAGTGPFVFMDADRRARARDAMQRGIDIILRTQIRQAGHLSAWCAQYDEVTLEPAWGRAYEPPSLSGSETVGIVRFLMGIERPTPEVVAAVDGAVAWLEAVAIHGVRVEAYTDSERRRDRRVIADPAAGPLWARFYGLDTNLPIFLGRDSVTRYALSEIEQERRGGYGYYGDWGAQLLAEYPGWRQRVGRAPDARLP
jgi:PelA/Pel-15E family pectate lyase